MNWINSVRSEIAKHKFISMNKKFFVCIISFSFILFINAQGQCKTGDCKNGRGVMDFGYAVYTGSFKNGLPDGQGIMDYGDGEKYEGAFKNGKEDGQGTAYSKGVAKTVYYKNGTIVQRPSGPVVIGGSKYISENGEECLSGNCVNGYSVMKFPSGNKYEGEFKDGRFHGKGKMTFASGNYIDATFKEHIPQDGTFHYNKENVTFKGTFTADARPLSGTYSYPAMESTVTIENGKITKVHTPIADKLEQEIKEANERMQPKTCDKCNGKGISGYSRATYSFTSENFGTDRYLYGRYSTRTTQGQAFPDICTKCGGSGKVRPR